MRFNFKRLYDFITAFNFIHFTNYFSQRYSFITRKAKEMVGKRPLRSIKNVARGVFDN